MADPKAQSASLKDQSGHSSLNGLLPTHKHEKSTSVELGGPHAPPYSLAVENQTASASPGAKAATGLTKPEGHVVGDGLTSRTAEVVADDLARFYSIDTPVPAHLPPLAKPALVPRVHHGPTFPFARAWAPELAAVAVTRDEWLAFLDHLNLLCFPHPAVTVIELAAVGVAYAPVEGADGLSDLVDALGDVVAHALAKARCRRFLGMANAEYFHPRRLHARIINTRRMRRALLLGKKDRLIAPLTEDLLAVSAQDRCLAYMKLHSCALDLDVPAPAGATVEAKVLERLARWRTRKKVRRRDRNARSSRKSAWKKMQKGKTLKHEAWGERSAVKMLDWVIVQNLDEFERQEREIAEEKERKKADRWWRKLGKKGPADAEEASHGAGGLDVKSEDAKEGPKAELITEVR